MGVLIVKKIDMIVEITGVSRDEATNKLFEAGGSTDEAVPLLLLPEH